MRARRVNFRASFPLLTYTLISSPESEPELEELEMIDAIASAAREPRLYIYKQEVHRRCMCAGAEESMMIIESSCSFSISL